MRFIFVQITNGFLSGKQLEASVPVLFCLVSGTLQLKQEKTQVTLGGLPFIIAVYPFHVMSAMLPST